jgi:hypothetical protein
MTARQTVLALFGVVIVGLVVLDVVARAPTTTHHHYHRAVPTTRPTPTTQSLGNPTVCATVAATNKLTNESHTSYLAAISSASTTDRIRYGAVLSPSYNPNANYGRYGPVISYLVSRYLHPDSISAPTIDVIDSADALDLLRTSRQCDHVGAP